MKTGSAVPDGRTIGARVRCPACGTEQEAPAEAADRALCIVCGLPLDAAVASQTVRAGRQTVPAEPEPGPPADLLDVHHDESAASHAAALPTEAPATRSVEVDEILANRKRTTTVLSLVPVVGLWIAWRSDSHSTGEKIVLSISSLLAVAGLVAVFVASRPDASERLAQTHARIAGELDTLVRLSEQYRVENGVYPDAAAWALSVKRSDPRFIDPWNRPFVYSLRENVFTIGTFGRDGAPGGEGEDGDVFVQGPVKTR